MFFEWLPERDGLAESVTASPHRKGHPTPPSILRKPTNSTTSVPEPSKCTLHQKIQLPERLSPRTATISLFSAQSCQPSWTTCERRSRRREHGLLRGGGRKAMFHHSLPFQDSPPKSDKESMSLLAISPGSSRSHVTTSPSAIPPYPRSSTPVQNRGKSL